MGKYYQTIDIKNFLSDTIGYQFWNQSRVIKFSDDSYYIPSLHEVIDFLNNQGVSKEVWKDQVFDCDDFSFVLKGRASLYGYHYLNLDYPMCLGIVWGYFNWDQAGEQLHSCNWLVFDNEGNLDFRWIEPQENKLHSLQECRGWLELMLV